eukprot:360794-Chlamydomonas_euryale.AAC.8
MDHISVEVVWCVRAWRGSYSSYSLSKARSLAVEQHRSMSALPNASKEVLKYLFGPPPPKGGVAQPVAKHDQARITPFFNRAPVPGKPPGTRQQQEEPKSCEAREQR